VNIVTNIVFSRKKLEKPGFLRFWISTLEPWPQQSPLVNNGFGDEKTKGRKNQTCVCRWGAGEAQCVEDTDIHTVKSREPRTH